jgi:hypothetical protein
MNKKPFLWLQLERRQMGAGQPLAVLRGRRPLPQRAQGFYSHVLRNHGYSVRVEDTTVPIISKTGKEQFHCYELNGFL